MEKAGFFVFVCAAVLFFGAVCSAQSADIKAFLAKGSNVPVPAVVVSSAAPDVNIPVSPLKTRVFSFTGKYQVALQDGVIYARRLGETMWYMVPGQPSGTVAVDADGDNLMAVDGQNVVRYMKFPTLKWKEKWGKPGSKLLVIPPCRGWAMSHLNDEAGGFHDPSGVFKDYKTKVTILYMLTQDGTKIKYADPWLPPDFAHRIAAPERGRFVAENIAASGSTVFLINKAGKMYTRLADFDTAGANPTHAYSFTKPGPHVTMLPAEDWRAQPDIAGRITAHITIFTTGKGNAGRELRVEGVDGLGRGGYYRKPIYGDSWTFVETGAKVSGPFLGGAAEQGPVIDVKSPVSYEKRLPEGSMILFSPDNDSAFITAPLASGKELVLPLYIRESFFATHKGKPNLLGTIVVPDDILTSADPETAEFVNKNLNRGKLHDVHVRNAPGNGIKLDHAPWRAIVEAFANHGGDE